MLTTDTFRVIPQFMTFPDILSQWPSLASLAGDLGLPVKNVRRWEDIGSIPAEWFVAVEKAAVARGIAGVTIKALANAAHARRLAKLPAEAANDDVASERAA
jgi:hypothetical protein